MTDKEYEYLINFHDKLEEMDNKLWSLQSDAYDTLKLEEPTKNEISIRLCVAREIIRKIDRDIIIEELDAHYYNHKESDWEK